MRKILVLTDWYFPGYKAGGPMRTIGNMVTQLGDEFEFRIFTRNSDLDDIPYPDVPIHQWITMDKAQVYYAPIPENSLRVIRRLVQQIKPDVVYLNSFFSTQGMRYLLLRRLRLIRPIPTILAPRGEFAPGALGIKSRKKSLYLWVAKHSGIYNGILWQASTPGEAEEIRREWGESVRLCVVSDLPTPPSISAPTPLLKAPGAIKLVYISRVTPKKNLLYALERLRDIPGAVTFDIYGLADDADYWRACQQAIAQLPPNITVTIHGAIPHEQVAAVLAEHHFFILPTLGENFGHAILESLSVGCPVLISDQTPWQNLSEHGAGWSLPLDQPDQWTEALRACINMNDSEYAAMSACAYAFAAAWINDSDRVREVREMLLNV